MARKSKKSSKLLKHRRLALISSAAVVVIVGLGFWHYHNRPNQEVLTPTTTKTGKTSSGSYVNLSPPTTQDKQAANDIKNEATQTTTPPPTTSDGRTQVTPTITSVNSPRIAFYVSAIFENGGTCTATATSSGSASPVTSTSTGFGNSNYTTCPPITLPLGSGAWSVVASYSSSDAVGSSQPQTVTIP